MSWLILFIAGLFEMAWAIGLKYSNGFTRFWPSIYTLTTMAISIYLLSVAVKELPIGTAYPVWTGIGAVATAIFGILYFNESYSFLRIFFICMIIAGIVGLFQVSNN
jgi:quaternary ammonium compound-resistance protein SugE